MYIHTIIGSLSLVNQHRMKQGRFLGLERSSLKLPMVVAIAVRRQIGFGA